MKIENCLIITGGKLISMSAEEMPNFTGNYIIFYNNLEDDTVIIDKVRDWLKEMRNRSRA